MGLVSSADFTSSFLKYLHFSISPFWFPSSPAYFFFTLLLFSAFALCPSPPHTSVSSSSFSSHSPHVVLLPLSFPLSIFLLIVFIVHFFVHLSSFVLLSFVLHLRGWPLVLSGSLSSSHLPLRSHSSLILNHPSASSSLSFCIAIRPARSLPLVPSLPPTDASTRPGTCFTSATQNHFHRAARSAVRPGRPPWLAADAQQCSHIYSDVWPIFSSTSSSFCVCAPEWLLFTILCWYLSFKMYHDSGRQFYKEECEDKH